MENLVDFQRIGPLNQHLVGEQEELLGLSPTHPCQGLKNAKAGAGAFGNSPDVRGEGEVSKVTPRSLENRQRGEMLPLQDTDSRA